MIQVNCSLVVYVFKVGERLGRLNVEKQKAIEMEDYDQAMVKKVFMLLLSYFRRLPRACHVASACVWSFCPILVFPGQ